MNTYAEEQGVSLKLQEREQRQKQRERNVRRVWMSIIIFSILFLTAVGVVAAGKMREIRETELQQAAVETKQTAVKTKQTSAETKHAGEETETGQMQETGRVRKTGPYPYHAPVDYSYTEALVQLEILAADYPEFEPFCKTFEKYPGNLMVALANNPDMISFAEGYLTADGKANGGLTAEEKAQKVPQLLQWDKRWGYVSYGDDNIALSGCAPTCLSMVIIALTGKTEVTPDIVADYAMENDYYFYGTGTKWEIMTEGCEAFGIQGEVTQPVESDVMAFLDAGNPIICSMGPGDFTAAGHFIVLSGIEDGKIRVNDPNSKVRSEKLWDFETIASQLKGMWVFY